ncbi:MAG: DUF4062 domain-containing protein, partial [Burkholderiales bacterium]|nr:DUF4062 domain-containing protein [Anaerolineae bacterium]
MPRSLGIFISSKMVELSEERRALEALLPTLGDDTLQLFPWVFETDAPASGSSIRSVYMNALDQSELYIGLFWDDYGEWTIDEFHRAGELGITRHLYVKNAPSDGKQRDPRLQAFLNQQSDVRFGITPRWFTDSDDLTRQVTRSVRQWLIERQIAHHSATTAVIARSSDDVPEVPRGLIGREDLIAEVHTLLDDGTRLLLRGFGGMGKTALAATIASERIDAGKGPVVWVKAGAADADAIFEALGRAFDEQQAIASAQGDERLQIIRHLLAEHKPLLVLDDVWNGSALALVVKALPRTMPLLVTSRQRYPLDETIEVAELKPDAALKLLSYHVRRRDFSADPDAQALCELLGYHAFALEIAGKTLKVYDLSAGDLIQRIQAAPHDLNMPGDFGELGRKGIKSLLDASVDALDRRLHDVFVTFGGLFEPTSTPELLALTMNADTADIRDALEQIELRGLVNSATREDIRYYRLHDLAYSYARTMFVSKGLSEGPVIEACRRYTAV